MPKCDFHKVAKQLYWNHTSASCSPVNLLHIFRTPFSKNTSGGLFLRIVHCLEQFYELYSSVQNSRRRMVGIFWSFGEEIITYNCGQNLWNNAKKSSKIGQDKKTLKLFLRNFWPLVPNFYLRKEDWVLGSVSYHFCDIPNIS